MFVPRPFCQARRLGCSPAPAWVAFEILGLGCRRHLTSSAPGQSDVKAAAAQLDCRPVAQVLGSRLPTLRPDTQWRIGTGRDSPLLFALCP